MEQDARSCYCWLLHTLLNCAVASQLYATHCLCNLLPSRHVLFLTSSVCSIVGCEAARLFKIFFGVSFHVLSLWRNCPAQKKVVATMTHCYCLVFHLLFLRFQIILVTKHTFTDLLISKSLCLERYLWCTELHCACSRNVSVFLHMFWVHICSFLYCVNDAHAQPDEQPQRPTMYKLQEFELSLVIL